MRRTLHLQVCDIIICIFLSIYINGNIEKIKIKKKTLNKAIQYKKVFFFCIYLISIKFKRDKTKYAP